MDETPDLASVPDAVIDAAVDAPAEAAKATLDAADAVADSVFPKVVYGLGAVGLAVLLIWLRVIRQKDAV